VLTLTYSAARFVLDIRRQRQSGPCICWVFHGGGELVFRIPRRRGKEHTQGRVSSIMCRQASCRRAKGIPYRLQPPLVQKARKLPCKFVAVGRRQQAATEAVDGGLDPTCPRQTVLLSAENTLWTVLPPRASVRHNSRPSSGYAAGTSRASRRQRPREGR